MNDRDKIAGMLAGLRDHGLSVPEIGRRLKISRAHAWRLTVGEVRKPSYEMFTKLERLTETVTKSARPPGGRRRPSAA